MNRVQNNYCFGELVVCITQLIGIDSLSIDCHKWVIYGGSSGDPHGVIKCGTRTTKITKTSQAGAVNQITVNVLVLTTATRREEWQRLKLKRNVSINVCLFGKSGHCLLAPFERHRDTLFWLIWHHQHPKQSSYTGLTVFYVVLNAIGANTPGQTRFEWNVLLSYCATLLLGVNNLVLMEWSSILLSQWDHNNRPNKRATNNRSNSFQWMGAMNSWNQVMQMRSPCGHRCVHA